MQGGRLGKMSSGSVADEVEDLYVQIFDFDRTISCEHTFSKKRLERFLVDENDERTPYEIPSKRFSAKSEILNTYQENRKSYSLTTLIENSNFHRKKPCNIAIDTNVATQYQQPNTFQDYLGLRFSVDKVYENGKEDAQFGLVERGKGKKNIKDGIPLKHDSFAHMSCIATYHNNPSYIAGYVSILLGKELIWKESIGSRSGKYNLDGPEVGINIYEVEGCTRIFCISYIPEIGNDFGKCLKQLTGKNNQINFLRFFLIENEYITEETRIQFYDDDSENVDKVSYLNFNIVSNLIDGFDNNAFTISNSEEHYAQSKVVENDKSNIKNRRKVSREKKLLKERKNDPPNNGQKKHISEERDMSEENIKINKLSNITTHIGGSSDCNTSSSKSSTPHTDNTNDNPGIFKMLLGASAATAAAVGAISLMK